MAAEGGDFNSGYAVFMEEPSDSLYSSLPLSSQSLSSMPPLSLLADVAKAFSATLEACRLWLAVFAPLLRLFFSILHGVFRLIRPFLLALVIRIRSTDPRTVALYLLALWMMLAVWVIKREVAKRQYAKRIYALSLRLQGRVERRYNVWMARTQETFGRAAYLLSHGLLVALCAFSIRFLPRDYPIHTLEVIVGIIPSLLRSLFAIRDGREKDFALLLRYWICFAGIRILCLTPGISPLVQMVLSPKVRLTVMLWLQVPWTDGADLLCRGLATLPVFQGIMASAQGSKTFASLSTAFDMVGKMVVGTLGAGLSTRQLRFVTEAGKLIESGPLILLCIPFLLSMGTVTHIGCLFIGYGIPIYCTLSVLTNKTCYEKEKSWLEYWSAFIALDQVCSVVFGIVGVWPFFNHAKLLFILWLQLPYFSGAARVAQMFMDEEIWKHAAYTALTSAPALLQASSELKRNSGGPLMLENTDDASSETIVQATTDDTKANQESSTKETEATSSQIEAKVAEESVPTGTGNGHDDPETETTIVPRAKEPAPTNSVRRRKTRM